MTKPAKHQTLYTYVNKNIPWCIKAIGEKETSHFNKSITQSSSIGFLLFKKVFVMRIRSNLTYRETKEYEEVEN